MNIYATDKALAAWKSIPCNERARSLAATYFAPSALILEPRQDSSRQPRDSEYKKEGVTAIVRAAEMREFYTYWQNFVKALAVEDCYVLDARLQSRLLINLSGSILENAGLALEHICGVPIIPGSAVKGIVRRYAIALLQECENDCEKETLLSSFIKVFGCSENDFSRTSDLALIFEPDRLREMGSRYGSRTGLVNFLQAVPRQSIPLCVEVLTPHHRKYMSGRQNEPTDDEVPSTSFYPAVESGEMAVYTFVLHAPRHPKLLEQAKEWLSQALYLFGAGAKGAAGYGYFSVQAQQQSGSR